MSLRSQSNVTFRKEVHFEVLIELSSDGHSLWTKYSSRHRDQCLTRSPALSVFSRFCVDISGHIVVTRFL